MAITFTQLANATNDTSNATSYAGTAGTPAAGDLLLCFVSVTGSVLAAPTMTGTWTWTLARGGTFSGVGQYLFWAAATAATSTTPTFDCTGDAGTGCFIQCLRVTGGEGVTTPAIRQTGFASSAGSANPAIVFAAAPLAINGVCGVATEASNTAGQWTAPTGWTEHSDVVISSPSASFTVASRASGETLSTITWTNAQTAAWGGSLVEIWVPHARSPGGGMAAGSPMNY